MTEAFVLPPPSYRDALARGPQLRIITTPMSSSSPLTVPLSPIDSRLDCQSPHPGPTFEGLTEEFESRPIPGRGETKMFWDAEALTPVPVVPVVVVGTPAYHPPTTTSQYMTWDHQIAVVTGVATRVVTGRQDVVYCVNFNYYTCDIEFFYSYVPGTGGLRFTPIP